VRVVFHPRAVDDVARVDAWWKANRLAATALFQQELDEVLGALVRTPTLGALAPSDDELRDVRRALMKRTRYHLYYRILGDTLEVLAIWHSARGDGPEL
jgi:plasmid stabilization system protein ParE